MATFSLDISRWVAKVEGRQDQLVRRIALDMFRRVVLRSPVDTGRFRGNWQVAINSIPSGTLDVFDKAGGPTLTRLSGAVSRAKVGDAIYLVNNLPYAIPLEYGHSRQAPAGMVRITVQEFPTVVRGAAGDAQRGA